MNVPWLWMGMGVGVCVCVCVCAGGMHVCVCVQYVCGCMRAGGRAACVCMYAHAQDQQSSKTAEKNSISTSLIDMAACACMVCLLPL